MPLKYLIVRDRDDAEHAIVFPSKIIHKDVARIHRATDVRVVSAGMCYIGDQVQAFGFSESLKMSSRPEDTAILAADFEA